MFAHLRPLLLVACLLATPLPNITLQAAAPPPPPAPIKLVPESAADLVSLEQRVQAVVAKVSPAVVSVSFGATFGSGVLVKDGYVLTAGHVSGQPGRTVTIIFPDGKRVKGKTLGSNSAIDSGLIKIVDIGNWPTVEVGTSAGLKKDQWVIAIGQPGSFRVNRSPVVRLGRVLLTTSTLIRTDCTVVGGDSGGPLFDLDGKVVGIHSRIGGTIADNFHVPVDTFTSTWSRLVRGERWGGPLGTGQPVVPSPGGKVVFEKDAALTAADSRDKKRGESYCKVQEFKMVPGFDYTLDMTGGDRIKPFDPYLRLEDSAGRKLAEDDDGGGTQNARIVFRPVKEDIYRITLTTCDPDQTGPFTCTIRQFDLRDRLAGGKVDVLRAFKMPREIAPLYWRKMNKTGHVLFASGTLFDNQGKPVAGKEISFVWKTGSSKVLTNDKGVARLALSGETCKELMVEAPRDYRLLLELTDSEGMPQPLPFGAETLGMDRMFPAGGMIVLDAWNKLAASDSADKMRDGCRQQVHTFKMAAGSIYAIFLESPAFDAFLRLEDSAGKVLAQDDDGAGNLNARIIYAAARDDTVRIVVTTCEAGQTGAYRLTIRQQSRDEFAETAARLSIEQNPQDAQAHFLLGSSLQRKGDLAGAIAAFRTAAELAPRNGLFLNHLAAALHRKGDLEGAIAVFRKVVEVEPANVQVHNTLGQTLMLQARFSEARDAFRRAAELFSFKNPVGAQEAERHAHDCERLMPLAQQLPGLLEGREQPRANADRLVLAQYARSRRMFAQSARLLAAAFAADAKLADDVMAGHRFNAACCAALAATGQGVDATKLPEDERARLRKQALEWLRADLASWTRFLEIGPAGDRTMVATKLSLWKQDGDLVGLRDRAARKKWPADEQEAARKLWADVEALLRKAPKPSLPTVWAPSQGAYVKFSPQIAKLFGEVVVSPSKSTVRVRCNGKDVALGTIVAADGWIVTKRSELTGKITCKLPDGKELPAVIKGVHEPYDLAMLKVDAKALVPVTWQDSKAAKVGRWVASAGMGAEPAAIGVVSVATRPLKRGDQPPKERLDTGFLGVGAEDVKGGARIVRIERNSAAEKAGLKIGDIVTQAGTIKILTRNALTDTISRHRAGDVVALKIQRGKDNLEVKATLAKRPFQFFGNPQDLLGSVLSNRRGGFPFILQHDTVLKQTDCGGPLVDLDGKVVGINIARAGRVESYAIPAEVVRQLLPELLSGKLAPKEETK